MQYRPVRFPTGEVRATTAALANVSKEKLIRLVNRHIRGDWGDTCMADQKANEQAIRDEDRILSWYVGKLCVFWIRLITRKGDYNMYLNAYIKEERYQKYFDFLEKLRQSGETNMYGAAPYLQSEFPELRGSQEKANTILIAWIKTFETEEGDESC